MTTVAVAACDDPPRPSEPLNPPATYPQGCPTLANDGDSASTPFMPVTGRSIVDATGFNLDGINNAPSKLGGRGSTLSGCDTVDLQYGNENAFAAATGAVADTVTIDPRLADVLEVRLTHLSAFGVADDACVGVELRVGGEGGRIVKLSGSLTDHVAGVVGFEPIDLAFTTSVDPAACVGTACASVPIRVHIERPIAVLSFDPTNEHVIARSTIGGGVFFAPSGGSDEPTSPGFEAELASFASAAGIHDDFATRILGAFASRQDLRTTPTWLTQCTEANPPNALSFAITVDSDP